MTGRGGAVGDGYLKQELRDLTPGNYELSAAAQNIQEDNGINDETGKEGNRDRCLVWHRL